MRTEVLSGVERRRRWSIDEKARIIGETLVPGTKVSTVARRYGISASLLFYWRRQARTDVKAPPRMVPVLIAAAGTNEAVLASCERPEPAPACRIGMMEIELGRDRRIRVDAQVDADALARIIDVLERR
ncbi:MAG TPA: transposase [Methylovirgula sp.]